MINITIQTDENNGLRRIEVWIDGEMSMSRVVHDDLQLIDILEIVDAVVKHALHISRDIGD